MGMFDMREISALTKRILIAAILLTEGCGGAPQPEADFKAVRAEILAIEDQWATAIERPDATAFERIAARSHNPENVESAVQDQIEVRQYGDAAIATGRSILHGTRAEAPFIHRFRWTDVYVRRGGRRQAVSAQLTALSPNVE
jgi:Domain of unknown function (DUF4440)